MHLSATPVEEHGRTGPPFSPPVRLHVSRANGRFNFPPNVSLPPIYVEPDRGSLWSYRTRQPGSTLVDGRGVSRGGAHTRGCLFHATGLAGPPSQVPCLWEWVFPERSPHSFHALWFAWNLTSAHKTVSCLFRLADSKTPQTERGVRTPSAQPTTRPCTENMAHRRATCLLSSNPQRPKPRQMVFSMIPKWLTPIPMTEPRSQRGFSWLTGNDHLEPYFLYELLVGFNRKEITTICSLFVYKHNFTIIRIESSKRTMSWLSLVLPPFFFRRARTPKSAACHG